MIVVLKNDITAETTEGQNVIEYLTARPGITPKVHAIAGTGRTLTEIYVVGDTSALDQIEIEALPGVEKVVRVSRSYAVIGVTSMIDADMGLPITTSNSIRPLCIFLRDCAPLTRVITLNR